MVIQHQPECVTQWLFVVSVLTQIKGRVQVNSDLKKVFFISDNNVSSAAQGA